MTRVVALFFCFALIWAYPFTAFCVSVPFTGTVNKDGVHVRADSTVGAVSICQVQDGQAVEVVGASHEWYRIRLPGQAPVYISGTYVKLTDDNLWLVTGDNVNLRLSPDLGAPILGQADKGTEVRVMKKAGDWYQIKPLPSTSGWIHSKFVLHAEDAPRLKKPVPPEKTVTKEQASDGGRPQEAEGPVVQGVTLEGRLKSKFITTVATHKLITATGDLYLLRSDAVALSEYVRAQVRITGEITGSAGSASIVEVKKIEEIY
ncbi:MAG: SH3 domain-containing protein [Candidatus Omnitrophica bacterium]|nr:SH3 domain-containing protein [Candidatus Omnitrophota bacterium]